MTSEQFIKFREMIECEYSAAVTKHPKFCDHFIDESKISWSESEMKIKAKNEQPTEYADCVLMEEVAEAMNAYSQGEKKQCLQELAQCGAVIFRMMELVDGEIHADLRFS